MSWTTTRGNIGRSKNDDDDDDDHTSIHEPVYLASYRISNVNSWCYLEIMKNMLYNKSYKNSKEPHKIMNYIGFALLRSDLTIIVDTVVDFKSSIQNNIGIEDPRLFIFNTTTPTTTTTEASTSGK